MLRAEVLEFAEEFSEFLYDNPEHNNDKEVVLVAVKNNPDAYKYASIELQADEDVINA
jgi:trehalose-6-phosphate synthase